MADIAINKTMVRPLNNAIIRRFEAAAVMDIGTVVYIDTNGKVNKAQATTAAAAQARGIVVGVGATGKSTCAIGDALDVVTHGPVELGVTGLTDGSALYVSATAGLMDQTAPATAGQFKYVIGYAHSDMGIYVQGQMVVPAAN